MLSRLHGSLVEGDRLSLLYAQRSGGTDAQAETRAIAQLIVQHPGFAIHQLYCSLRAGNHTQATAGAQFLINPHDLTCCHNNLHSLCLIREDDLERARDRPRGTEFLAITTVLTILGVRENHVLILQGQGFHGTHEDTVTASCA
jgi:hypothetical protein